MGTEFAFLKNLAGYGDNADVKNELMDALNKLSCKDKPAEILFGIIKIINLFCPYRDSNFSEIVLVPSDPSESAKYQIARSFFNEVLNEMNNLFEKLIEHINKNEGVKELGNLEKIKSFWYRLDFMKKALCWLKKDDNKLFILDLTLKAISYMERSSSFKSQKDVLHCLMSLSGLILTEGYIIPDDGSGIFEDKPGNRVAAEMLERIKPNMKSSDGILTSLNFRVFGDYKEQRRGIYVKFVCTLFEGLIKKAEKSGEKGSLPAELRIGWAREIFNAYKDSGLARESAPVAQALLCNIIQFLGRVLKDFEDECYANASLFEDEKNYSETENKINVLNLFVQEILFYFSDSGADLRIIFSEITLRLNHREFSRDYITSLLFPAGLSNAERSEEEWQAVRENVKSIILEKLLILFPEIEDISSLISRTEKFLERQIDSITKKEEDGYWKFLQQIKALAGNKPGYRIFALIKKMEEEIILKKMEDEIISNASTSEFTPPGRMHS